MSKFKKILVFTLLFTLSLSFSFSYNDYGKIYADDNNTPFKIGMYEFMGEDEDYLYILGDKDYSNNSSEYTESILRINKDMSSEFEILDEYSDVGSSISSPALKSLEVEGKEFKDITLKDKKLYINAGKTEILDINKYFTEREEGLKNNPMFKERPLTFICQSFDLGNKSILYHIQTEPIHYPAPYQVISNDYVLEKDGQLLHLDIANQSALGEFYLSKDGAIFMQGHDSTGKYNRNDYVHHIIASNGKVTLLNQKNKEASHDNLLSCKIIGINNGKIVVMNGDINKIIENEFSSISFAEYSDRLISSTRDEKITDFNKTHYPNLFSTYLANNNHIYYLTNATDNQNAGICDLSTQKIVRYGKRANSKHKVGDVLGKFEKSIGKYLIVNKGLSKIIPTYTFDGKDYFIVEDLQKYAYKMKWDVDNRCTYFTKDESDSADFSGTSEYRDKNDVICSDIKIFIDNHLVESYNIDGFSLVPVDALKSLQIRKAPDKPVGSKMGDVMYTDIKAYLNGILVKTLNVDGYTAVSIQEIHQRGYLVSYDNDARTVYIYRDKQLMNPKDSFIESKNLRVGHKLGDIISSDIIVDFDGVIVPAYNYKGYMYIMTKDFYKLDFDINYNDDKRRLDLDDKNKEFKAN